MIHDTSLFTRPFLKPFPLSHCCCVCDPTPASAFRSEWRPQNQTHETAATHITSHNHSLQKQSSFPFRQQSVEALSVSVQPKTSDSQLLFSAFAAAQVIELQAAALRCAEFEKSILGSKIAAAMPLLVGRIAQVQAV